MKKFALMVLTMILAVSLLACGKKDEIVPRDLAEVWTEMAAGLGEMSAKMDMDDTALTEWYGISKDDLVQYVGKLPLMNVSAEEFFMAEVKEDKMKDVEAGIAKRIESLKQTWEQYLPDQYELVKNAKTVKVGNYILFVVSENADKAEELFTQAFQKQESNTK